MTPAKFVAKWSRASLPERAASHEHFIDLCRLLGQPTPAEHDATGAEYTFEKGVTVTGSASRGSKGDAGFADVWWRCKFGWEYKRKGKYKDLAEAYRQLLQYREALQSPPLLVVCDIGHTEIHTNFTGTTKQVHTILLEELPDKIDVLRRVFTDPESFRPQVTTVKVTEAVAERIGELARGLHTKGHDPHTAAHFLMKCMFCLFAEDVELLPNKLFSQLLKDWHDDPKQLQQVLTELFAKMASGGAFGRERIPYFNGGLFDAAPALELDYDQIGLLRIAAAQDWSAVEPAVFGTLFERSLDPSKRAQIGAHYTSRDDIMLIVEPVVMAPLRRQWQEVKTQIDAQLVRRRTAKTAKTGKAADEEIGRLLLDFDHRLASLRILDPACGSGNFLYVAIQQMLFLEKEVCTFAARPEIGQGLIPQVRPTQLHGIELNPYASELAQVVIWIGYLQWMRDNGFRAPSDPILQPLQTIENRDAILTWADERGQPLPAWREGAVCKGAAPWPEADFIIGNPPFLGSKLFRKNGLSDSYVQAVFDSYDLPKTSDLCCYWFELARRVIQATPTARAGLLATQGIRGAANREVIQRILADGGVFFAESDRDWILDGAAVHVSMLGFDDGSERPCVRDGVAVETLNADLTAGADYRAAAKLPENANIAFMADTKGNHFEDEWHIIRPLLGMPNPTDRKNSDVLRPWVNGRDIMQRCRGLWIIDFGCDMFEQDAAQYEAPFERVRANVLPERRANRRESYAKFWWRHVEPRPRMRKTCDGLPRVLATVITSPHRLFTWLPSQVLPDHKLIVFAREDDYFLGVLHSAPHELWARKLGGQVREAGSGFSYTPSEGFETFALPWAPGAEPAADPLHAALAQAAKELDEMRQRWLNPPEWIEPIAASIDAMDKFADVPAEARGLIRQSAIMAAAAKDPNLKKRTLTNLYNERPSWLKLAHRKLDEAVLAAYAAIDPEGGWSADWAEVWQDTGACQPLPADHPLASRRQQVDQQVLSNLLRLNQARSEAK